MRLISVLSCSLILLCVLTCAASGAPAKSSPNDMKAVPDVAQASTVGETATRFRQKEPPKEEGLHKLGDAPKKFAFAAGAAVIAIVWNVFLVLAVITGLLLVVYYVRRRAGVQTDRTEALAAAFDDVRKKVSRTRKELQKKVNILAKRDVAPAAKKKTAKPRKRATRAKKTS
jgi:hypothetical protein